MAFLAYSRKNENGTSKLEKLSTVKLAGADGAIAKHIAKLQRNKEETILWHLNGSQLLEEIGISNAVLVFDLDPNSKDRVCLYELLRIAGETGPDYTEMVLQFRVLHDGKVDSDTVTFKKSFEITDKTPYTQVSESVMLTGGWKGGAWKWTMPEMNLGFAIVSKGT